jgi:ABC-type dipeptide/oligopeptide/nickel transport system ATPase component
MAGMVPHLAALPPGCAFSPRCPVRFEPCDREVPTLQGVGGTGDRLHLSACYHESAVLQAMAAR